MKPPLISRQILLPGVLIAASCIAGWAAAGRPAVPAAAGGFQYVGLDRSIARIDPADGRLWVLRHRGSGQLSLLAAPAEPGWAWQEVRIESEAATGPMPQSGRYAAP